LSGKTILKKGSFQNSPAGIDYLPISAVAEIYYCPRNFYYRFVEKLEQTDYRMEKGKLPEEKRGLRERLEREGYRQLRKVMFSSDTLGLIGVIDALEEKDGLLYPVEYKVGELKESLSDQVQLCAQGMVLEEELGRDIPFGYLHYSESNRRVKVFFDDILKDKVLEGIESAREIASSGIAPEPVADERCSGCSLLSVCLPGEVEALRKKKAGEVKLVPSVGVENVLYVDEQGAILRKKGGRLTVLKEGKEIASVPLGRVQQVVLVGNVQITSQMIRYFLRNDVEIVYISSYGRYEGRFQPEMSKNSLLRIKQFERAHDPSFCLKVGREIVRGKINNSRVLLQRAARRNGSAGLNSAIDQLKIAFDASERCKNLDSLLGIEGGAARNFFKGFGLLIKEELPFDFEKRTRRPPRDPVNALLSFGYTLLTSDCLSLCNVVGFDPYLGFYHQARYGRPSLPLDIGMINKGVIKADDFEEKMGSFFLKEKGREKFFSQYRKAMESEAIHPVFKYRLSYRRTIEIQFRLLAKLVEGEIEDYVAFRIR
jgi:CRISPR-associated protein Cas1